MAVTQYIGARYVPLFADPAEWSPTKQYEPLTIVLHEGSSFTSRQFVPVGIDILNSAFWAETGNYNAQVAAYKSTVDRFITNNPITTPEMYGAKGDGSTDDTEAIHQCIENGTVIVMRSNATYRVSCNGGNYIPANDVTIFGNGATISLINTESPSYNIIRANNSRICDLKIVGDKDENHSTGEWGHGIYAHGNDVFIENCEISKCFGDGIYVTDCTNITISRCNIHDCRRQGISVISATNLFIDGCVIHSIRGTSPETGIDFEPNQNNETFKNCVVNNTLIYDTNYASIAIDVRYSHQNNDIKIQNCILEAMVIFNESNYYNNNKEPLPTKRLDATWYNNFYISDTTFNKKDTEAAFIVVNDDERCTIQMHGLLCISSADTSGHRGAFIRSAKRTIDVQSVKNVQVNTLTLKGIFSDLLIPTSSVPFDTQTCYLYDCFFEQKFTSGAALSLYNIKYVTPFIYTHTQDTNMTLIYGVNNIEIASDAWSASRGYRLYPSGNGTLTIKNSTAYSAIPLATFVPTGWLLIKDGTSYSDSERAVATIPANSAQSFLIDSVAKTITIL